MGMFGYSNLPPGCTNRDIDRAAGADTSPESDEVYGLLEDAECAPDLIDKVIEIVDGLADRAYAERECPVCDKRREAEARAYYEAHPERI